MKRLNTALCVPLGMLLCLSGCTLAPKYTRPEAPIPTGWPSGPAYQQTPTPPDAPQAADLEWQQFFTDEKLHEAIAMALHSNRDLRIANPSEQSLHEAMLFSKLPQG